MTTDRARRYRELVRELAKFPQSVERLLAEHVPDRSGRCVSCTQGGRGAPHVVFPCTLYQVASDARAWLNRGKSEPPAA